MGRKKKINIEKEKENEDEKEITFPDIETESPEQNADNAQPEFVEESANHEKAKDELNKMLDDFSQPLDETEPVIIPDEKSKRGRKKKIFEDQPVLIPGELIVAVLNNVSTGGLTLLERWISKNPLPFEALSLNEKQATQLSPLAEKAFESLQIEKDPMKAFLYTYGGMVLSNYVLMKSLQQKETNIKK